MNEQSPRKFKRGQTSPDHPGKIFLRYGRTTYGNWREEWYTPESYLKFTSKIAEDRKKWSKSESGRKSIKRSLQKQIDSGYVAAYMPAYSKRWHSIPANRLIHNLRSRMRIALKHKGVKKDSKTEQTLGCSFEFFRSWIQGQLEPGMAMDNYGYRTWHVDHVIPVHIFDFSDPLAIQHAFNYRNCRPMWGPENQEKNGQFDFELVKKYELYDWLPYLQDSTPLSLAA